MEYLAIVLILAIGFIFLIKSTGKLKRRMRDLKAETFLVAEHADGLPIPQKTMAYIFPCPDRLVIESKKGKFEIPNERITKYAKLTEQDIKHIDKSVIGRAVVGGVLLGGLGAIVGGMSGIGSKTKTKTREYFVINFTDKNGETAAISFESNLNIDHFVSKFSETLNRSKGIEKVDPSQTITL